MYSDIFSSPLYNSKKVQEYILWREKRRQQVEEWKKIQEGLTKRLARFRFPTELESSPFEINSEEEELGMVFKMDAEETFAQVGAKNEEFSPKSVVDNVSPVMVEIPLAPKLVIDKVDLTSQETLSYEFVSSVLITDSLLKVIQSNTPQSKVVTQPKAPNDFLFESNRPYTFTPVREGLLSKLLAQPNTQEKLLEKMATSYIAGSDYSDFIKFPSKKAAEHLDLDTSECSHPCFNFKYTQGCKSSVAQSNDKLVANALGSLFSDVKFVSKNAAAHLDIDSSDGSQSNSYSFEDVGPRATREHLQLKPREVANSYDSSGSELEGSLGKCLWRDVGSENGDEDPRDSIQFPMSL